MGAGGDELAAGRQRVGEGGTGGAQVEAPRVGRADLVLQQAGGAREEHVRRHGPDDDQADVVGRQTGARDCLQRRPWPRSDVATRGRRCAARGCPSAGESTRRWSPPSSPDRRWSARAGARRSPATGSSWAAAPRRARGAGVASSAAHHSRESLLCSSGASSPK